MKKNNKKKYTLSKLNNTIIQIKYHIPYTQKNTIYLKKLKKIPLSKLNNNNKNIYMKTHKYFIFMVGRTVLTQPLQQQGHSDFPYHPSIPTI